MNNLSWYLAASSTDLTNTTVDRVSTYNLTNGHMITKSMGSGNDYLRSQIFTVSTQLPIYTKVSVPTIQGSSGGGELYIYNADTKKSIYSHTVTYPSSSSSQSQTTLYSGNYYFYIHGGSGGYNLSYGWAQVHVNIWFANPN